MPLSSGRVAAVVAAVAVLSLIPLAGTAQAEEGDGLGDLQVGVVDPTGSPVASQMLLVSTAGSALAPLSAAATLHTFTDLPTARYGIVAVAPWTGVTCAGAVHCEQIFTGPLGDGAVVGAVDVLDAEAAAQHTVRATRPAVIVGRRTVGSTLAVDLSDAMDAMASYPGAYTDSLVVQWMRDGVAIPGANEWTYATSLPDVGRSVAARLTYPTAAVQYFTSRGMDAAPRTLAGVQIAPAATRTTASLFRKTITADRTTSLRVDVTAGRLPAVGRVTVRSGRWTTTKALRNGSVRVSLPRLKPGKHTITTRYLGSREFASSTAKPTTLRVTRAPRR